MEVAGCAGGYPYFGMVGLLTPRKMAAITAFPGAESSYDLLNSLPLFGGRGACALNTLLDDVSRRTGLRIERTIQQVKCP